MSVVLGAGGLTMLLAPGWVVRHLSPGSTAPRTWLVRLLGARSLVQHGVLFAVPTRQGLQAGAAADGLHVASMVPVVALLPRFRRAAGVSAAYAAVSAAVQLAVAPQSDDGVRVPGDLP